MFMPGGKVRLEDLHPGKGGNLKRLDALAAAINRVWCDRVNLNGSILEVRMMVSDPDDVLIGKKYADSSYALCLQRPR